MRFLRRNICIPPQGENATELARDFTFIDDIVAGILGALDSTPPSVTPQVGSCATGKGRTLVRGDRSVDRDFVEAF